MSYPGTIFLFDVDGVLVEPLGYRAAMMATTRHFSDLMQLDPALIPNLEAIEQFEAMHITSEWDMVQISLATILNALVQSNPGINLPSTVGELGKLNFSHYSKPFDYREPIVRLAPYLSTGEYPASLALRYAGDQTGDDGTCLAGIFPQLSGTPLLCEILSYSRDPYRSPITRIFQHYSLGSQVFTCVYALPSELDTDSMLIAHDKPMLSAEMQAELNKHRAGGQLGMVALTNRPSAPPREVKEKLLGYAPEAEMALEITNLADIPLISFGRIRYLAERHGIEAETLLKPSPVQAIAAILAGLIGQELPALETALSMVNNPAAMKRLIAEPGQVLDLAKLPIPLNIHIFEDTLWGIEATRNAGNILREVGIDNRIFAWGIAKNPTKADSLLNLGAIVFQDTESAIRAAFESC